MIFELILSGLFLITSAIDYFRGEQYDAIYFMLGAIYWAISYNGSK